MFHWRECFKGAVGVWVASFLAFHVYYHHTVHYSVVGASVMAAFPVFFGIIGLLEGF
jgi:hypothetical protein